MPEKGTLGEEKKTDQEIVCVCEFLRMRGSARVSEREISEWEREIEQEEREKGEGLSDQEILWNLTRFENPFQMFKT